MEEGAGREGGRMKMEREKKRGMAWLLREMRRRRRTGGRKRVGRRRKRRRTCHLRLRG
jgi:hypothetical protein